LATLRCPTGVVRNASELPESEEELRLGADGGLEEAASLPGAVGVALRFLNFAVAIDAPAHYGVRKFAARSCLSDRNKIVPGRKSR